MKLTSILAAVLLVNTAEAVQVKSQAQMLAEIEQMSMNANMQQVSRREKALLKTYMQVDMNEYLQQQMDSKLFEGVDEMHKSQFIGNFFHWVKCRFQDCNLLQTKEQLNLRQQIQIAEKEADSQPTAADSKKREDKKDLNNWASGKGNGTPAHSAGHTEPTGKDRYPKGQAPVTAA